MRDSSEDRRLAAVSTEEILEVALQTFAEKGDEGTSVRDIARRLNVSHNLIPIRIGTKEELRCSSA